MGIYFDAGAKISRAFFSNRLKNNYVLVFVRCKV